MVMLAQIELRLRNILGKSHVMDYIQSFFTLFRLELETFVSSLPCFLNISF